MATGNVRYGHVCDRCGKRRVRELARAHNPPDERFVKTKPEAGRG